MEDTGEIHALFEALQADHDKLEEDNKALQSICMEMASLLRRNINSNESAEFWVKQWQELQVKP